MRGPRAVLLNIANDRQSEGLFAPYFFDLCTLLALWAGIGLMPFATMTSRSGRKNNKASKIL